MLTKIAFALNIYAYRVTNYENAPESTLCTKSPAQTMLFAREFSGWALLPSAQGRKDNQQV